MPSLYGMGMYYAFSYKSGIFRKEHFHSGFTHIERYYFEKDEKDAKQRFVTYLLDKNNEFLVKNLIVDKVVYDPNLGIDDYKFTEFAVIPTAIYAPEITIEELKHRMPAPDFIAYCEYIRKTRTV